MNVALQKPEALWTLQELLRFELTSLLLLTRAGLPEARLSLLVPLEMGFSF